MVDKIVELEDDREYLILDETILNDKKYYYGLRLNQQEEVTNNYLFFEEVKNNDNEIFLLKVEDSKIREVLLTAFTINYLDKVYDEV